MPSPAPESRSVLVFHAGALGDFVLIWPLLRALASAGRRVHLVAADAHARLAARFLGTRPISGELREVTLLWRSPDAAEVARAWGPLLGACVPSEVISFVASADTQPGRAWIAAAAAIPGVREVIPIGPPGSVSRAEAWRRFEVERRGAAPTRPPAPDGPILAHVGAGGRHKTWPLERFVQLAESEGARGRTVRLIAGEVEHERFSADERRLFQARDGRLLTSLDELADALLSASTFIGADTGPTHLAAQLGVPTLALFGPTDPAVWAPVGPAVRVLAPARPATMEWLPVENVRLGLNTLADGPATSN